jgi:acyl carrier protein
MTTTVEERIRSFIVDELLFGQGDGLGSDDSLSGRGVIDSTGVLEVVSFLEETFGIRVEDRELLPENLDSIGRLAAFVGRKQAG